MRQRIAVGGTPVCFGGYNRATVPMWRGFASGTGWKGPLLWLKEKAKVEQVQVHANLMDQRENYFMIGLQQ